MQKGPIAIILFLFVNVTFGQEFTDFYGEYLGQIPPGNTPVVFAPGIISTIYMEHSVLVFSPDGNEVFWRVEWGPGLDRSLYNPDTWISNKTMKRIGNRWTVPMASSYSDRPVFSHDGKRIYFSDYCVEKQDSTWSEPKNLGLVARFSEIKFVYEPSITRDGTLYFSSDTAGMGRLEDHVFFRTRLLNCEYTKLERLPRCINLPSSWNYSLFIAPDESYLIFTSNRPGSLDNFGDLYISFHNINEDTWSEPVSLGEPINTRGQDSSPGVSPDGKYLFFTRPNAGHQADIFWVSSKIIDTLREKENLLK
jgi:Tol biopolymer transport system component